MLQSIIKGCLQSLTGKIFCDVELDPDPYDGRHAQAGVVLQQRHELAGLVHGEISHAIGWIRVTRLHDDITERRIQYGDGVDAQRLEGYGRHDGLEMEGLAGLVQRRLRIVRVLLVCGGHYAHKVLEAEPPA